MMTLTTSRADLILIDDADFELVSQYTWHSCVRRNKIYAKANIGRNKTLYMHRLLLNVASDVDHRDGNGLNNQRSNLRAATRQQNLGNKRNLPHTSKYKGVSKVTRKGKWNGRFQAHIRGNGKNIFLGIFTDEKEAAKAYDKAALKYFGEFARPNFSETGAS